MFNFAARLASLLALLAAMLWVALPAVAAAAMTSPQVEGQACPCCEGQATASGAVACPGCQASPTVGNEHTAPTTNFRVAWLMGPDTAIPGIELLPAEPPPR